MRFEEWADKQALTEGERDFAREVWDAAVGKGIHERLKNVLQQIFYDQKVCVLEVVAEWVDVSIPDWPDKILVRTEIRTEASEGAKNGA